jgi:peptidoglycan/LPS O-acetylase OafA/YrhL
VRRASAARAATSRQIPALDGIRGLAIVWVVLHNTTDLPTTPSGGAFHLFLLLAHPGWIGVQLFFALSGLLITAGLLDSQGTQNYFSGFYAKRALRILPLYYSVLLALLVLLPRLVTLPAPFTTEGQASLWLFTANLTQQAPYGFGHFWSLAVEEQFYLIWPFLVFWLTPRGLLVACLWTSAGALALRWALAAYGTDWWTLYAATPCRMDALALGGAGACILRLPRLREWLGSRTRTLALVSGLLFVVGIPLTHAYDRAGLAGETIGYTLLALSSAGFVTAVAVPDRAPVGLASLLSWRPLASCGRYSYAMYVFHQLLHKLLGEPWLHARFGDQPTTRVIFFYSVAILLVTYLLGFLSYHGFERHFLRMKRFFAPRG